MKLPSDIPSLELETSRRERCHQCGGRKRQEHRGRAQWAGVPSAIDYCQMGLSNKEGVDDEVADHTWVPEIVKELVEYSRFCNFVSCAVPFFAIPALDVEVAGERYKMKMPYFAWVYLLWTLSAISLFPVCAVNRCKILQEKADCSHLELYDIPSDLPVNIKVLDLSHNRLKKLPAANLSRYEQLEHLDVGYNTLHIIEPELCEHLPLLKIFNLQHNEFTKIPEKTFLSCTNLIELYLNSNGIREITANPFKSLKNLKILHMCYNKMTSMALGDTEQLSDLTELLFSHNLISELKKEALVFLGNNSIQQLDLSSNPVKVIHPGCFQPLKYLNTLIMANMTLGPNLIEQLCTELAATQIKVLILLNSQLSKIHNTTFEGLASTSLATLDISKNSLIQIDNDSFIYLQSLTFLNLQDNQISHLSSGAFKGLTSVKSLNLQKFFSSSKDPKIDDMAFQWLRNLEHLNIEKNKNIYFTPFTFTGLTSLKTLSLTECSFQSFTNKTFLSLSKSPLMFLNLTKTSIAKLEYGVFSSLEHLEILDVGLNKMEQNLSGYEFQGLKSIKTIYLSYNKHLALTSTSFSFVPTLEKLNLRKTALTFKAEGTSPFSCLRNLTFLDLGNNNIANIAEDFFSDLHSLRILNLQHNNLARLWKKANPGGPVLFLKGLQNLEILDLLSNGFDEIPTKAFKGLSNLNILDLGENNLYLLPPSLFEDQGSLESLDLHKNLITSVEQDTFKNLFNNLKRFNMCLNPFDCTCESIAWFSNWLNTTNTSVIGQSTQYVCNTPNKYHGIFVEQFDSAPCKDTAPFKAVFILTFSVTSCFLFLVLFLHFQGWRIQFYWDVVVNTILGFRVIDPGHQNFMYDAYIIHASKDIDWVYKYLLPFEEDAASQLRFCFEERDFEAGLPIPTLIVNSIRRSRKIIFVISHDFLNDKWCRRFKIHQALQQVIEQSRDSIILLFVEDIADYKLNHSLKLRRGMFKSRCILQWPAHKERLNAFKQKFKIALGSTNVVN
ncbi:PREDICTED: toll-like receptor 3 [Nanorana parkeri]|uniref:toll-like receptor 3 n=1 Tax=Nanorana parkeri TaxID=125878 RepID=UPI0008542928|nr:PREDICTED: toll-like receptor 3 [Nanorana parkeri]